MADSITEDDLLATLRQVVGKSSKRRMAKRIGIAHTTLGELLDPANIRRPYGPTLEKIETFLRRHGTTLGASRVDKVFEAAATYEVTRTPLGDAVLIAVGRFEFMHEMAAKIAEMAARGGLELKTAATVPPEAVVPIDDVRKESKVPGRPGRVRKSKQPKSRPARRAS